jgi:hypothetical protein
MKHLPETHPDAHEEFLEGTLQFSIRLVMQGNGFSRIAHNQTKIVYTRLFLIKL